MIFENACIAVSRKIVLQQCKNKRDKIDKLLWVTVVSYTWLKLKVFQLRQKETAKTRVLMLSPLI